MTITLNIGYPKDAHFDLAYYLEKHLPLAGDSWKRAGMGPWRALAGADPNSPYAVLVQIEWPSIEAFQRAQAETPPDERQRFMDDMKNFTDKEPVVWVMENKAGGA
ncbi:hypothetical protein AAE478_006246 [Parahypoxylon ruwenzoriense]